MYGETVWGDGEVTKHHRHWECRVRYPLRSSSEKILKRNLIHFDPLIFESGPPECKGLPRETQIRYLSSPRLKKLEP